MPSDRDRDGRGKWVVGGAGLALLLLLLRRGSGFGLGTGVGTRPAGPVAPCRVRIDQAGVQVDGTRADLATTVAICRAAGAADVTATGAAIVGVIAEVVRALQDAGVTVRAQPAVWDTVTTTPARKP